MKFTFKTEKPTGKYHSFYTDHHIIKLKKAHVGQIVDVEWKIRLKVMKDNINEDGNPNCKWKWITLKKKSNSLQEAKEFLNENFQDITTIYKIAVED